MTCPAAFHGQRHACLVHATSLFCTIAKRPHQRTPGRRRIIARPPCCRLPSRPNIILTTSSPSSRPSDQDLALADNAAGCSVASLRSVVGHGPTVAAFSSPVPLPEKSCRGGNARGCAIVSTDRSCAAYGLHSAGAVPGYACLPVHDFCGRRLRPVRCRRDGGTVARGRSRGGVCCKGNASTGFTRGSAA